jgi:uncharacterized protein (PEP-CTERM system associated)
MTALRPSHLHRGFVLKCLPAALMLVMTGVKAQSLPAAPVDEVGAPSAELSASPKKTFSIVPRVSVTQTFTDNANLNDRARLSDQITDISPGIRITSDGQRLKAYFDYSLRELIYANGTSNSTSQNSLNTFGSFRAIDNWAAVDFSSTISQQAISAFGTQSGNNGTVNANLTETATTRVSPYIQGILAGGVSYVARYDWFMTHSKSELVSDTTVRNGSIKFSSDRGPSKLAWNLSLSQMGTDYAKGRSTEDDAVQAVLTYLVTPQFNVYAIGGRESNNYLSVNKEAHGSGGWGFNWTPSDVTRVSASRESRYFGESHNVSLEHRTGRTVWKYSDVKDVSSTPSQGGAGSVGTLYDLLFLQFASIEPDPVKRAGLVNNFLQANGLSPNVNVVSGFLTSAVSLQRRQDLMFAIRGIRDTVTFSATQSETQRLDAVSTGQDDLNNSGNIKQRGFSVNLAHRLTPESSVNALVSRQDAIGAVAAAADTSTKSLLLNFSTRIGAQSSATLGARRVLFEGGTVPYSETAVTGSLNLQF